MFGKNERDGTLTAYRRAAAETRRSQKKRVKGVHVAHSIFPLLILASVRTKSVTNQTVHVQQKWESVCSAVVLLWLLSYKMAVEKPWLLNVMFFFCNRPHLLCQLCASTNQYGMTISHWQWVSMNNLNFCYYIILGAWKMRHSAKLKSTLN